MMQCIGGTQAGVRFGWGFFVKAVDRELMHQSHLVISKSPGSRLIQNFKAMFSKMLIEPKNFFYLVMPHNNEACAIYQAQFPSSKAKPNFNCQIM
jgi:hypothetical protein